MAPAGSGGFFVAAHNDIGEFVGKSWHLKEPAEREALGELEAYATASTGDENRSVIKLYTGAFVR